MFGLKVILRLQKFEDYPMLNGLDTGHLDKYLHLSEPGHLLTLALKAFSCACL